MLGKLECKHFLIAYHHIGLRSFYLWHNTAALIYATYS